MVVQLFISLPFPHLLGVAKSEDPAVVSTALYALLFVRYRHLLVVAVVAVAGWCWRQCGRSGFLTLAC